MRSMYRVGWRIVVWGGLCALATPVASAEDQTQWGQRFSRNMVSDEKNLPTSFDPATGRNVQWTAELGSETYATPIIAGGRVYIGTNNRFPRDGRHQGDRGVLFCLDAKDGSLLWQLVVPKLTGDPYLDWPGGGIVSPPTVEGERLWTVTNRGEVVCLDARGLANGNDGPFRDEGAHQTPAGQSLIEPGKLDADIVWLFDIVSGAGIHPHDAGHSSILLDGQYLYVNTSNGVDNTHRRIRKPDAPSLIVLDKNTGRLLARDQEGIGPRIFHCTWSSPALGEVAGRPLVFFGGGDGVCYAFQPLTSPPPAGEVASLKRVWRFDCDPNAPKENVHRFTGNRRESPSNIMGMPVFHNGRVYVAAGGDMWWGKRECWLKCIDATKTGDITTSGLVWSATLSRHCSSTPSIHDGLVYIADCGRIVRCLDAQTGKELWAHETKGPNWGSTMVADGKVYFGSRGGDLWVLAAGREKKILANVQLDSAISGCAVPANGVIYIATMRKLYAVKEGAGSRE